MPKSFKVKNKVRPAADYSDKKPDSLRDEYNISQNSKAKEAEDVQEELKKENKEVKSLKKKYKGQEKRNLEIELEILNESNNKA